MPLDIKVYRAGSMHEALALVRRDLGPAAAVLHTREVRSGWLRRARLVEVTASASVHVPSRLPARPAAALPAAASLHSTAPAPPTAEPPSAPPADSFRNVRRGGPEPAGPELSDSLFTLFTDLLDADLGEHAARELVERLRRDAAPAQLADAATAKARLAQLLIDDMAVSGAIRVTPGHRHLVALVGPTGVGKTTTIAKLAAHYRLKEKRRVGLITVDTYRIAAVEQLRTYADIIDLPMEVVATPREMRQAVARMGDLELVLLDTAGRSPRDEVQLQELKSMLSEAAPDEVFLVLSSCASTATLQQTAARFAAVGATSLVLTKLDESSGLGNLLPLLRDSRLPLSYLTNGQSVPDDIEPAAAPRLARIILGLEPSRK
jgi:flagellar biosynthesis protein FlhF